MLEDTRAQAVGYSNFFLALLVGAIMFWVVDAVTSPILATARDHGSDPVAEKSTGWITEFINTLPLMWLFIAFFSLVVLSVFLRKIS